MRTVYRYCIHDSMLNKADLMHLEPTVLRVYHSIQLLRTMARHLSLYRQNTHHQINVVIHCEFTGLATLV